MSKQRFILEMGMGNDLHGMDYQKAARRAIESALRRSTLPMFETTGLNYADMSVEVTVAVMEPTQLDTDDLALLLPRGQATVKAVSGGQNIENPETGETLVIATVAIEAFLANQSSAWTKG